MRSTARREEAHSDGLAAGVLPGRMVAEAVVAAVTTEGTGELNTVAVADSAGHTTNWQPEQVDYQEDTDVGGSKEERHDARYFDTRPIAQEAAVGRRPGEVGDTDTAHGGVAVAELVAPAGKGMVEAAVTEARDTNTYYYEAVALGQSDIGEARLFQWLARVVQDNGVAYSCLAVSLGPRDMGPLRTLADDSEATPAEWSSGVGSVQDST